MSAEPPVLDHEDDGEGDSPVTEQRDKVRDDGGQGILAGDSKDGNHERVEERPDESRDGMEVMAQELYGQARGVVDGDVVPQDGEDQDYETEFGEVEGMVGLTEQATESMVSVRVGQDRIRIGIADRDVPKARPNHSDEDGGDGDTEQREGPDLPRLRVRRVVAVVVRSNRTPARGGREVEGEEGEEGGREFDALVFAWKTGVDLVANFADQDHYQDESCDPRILLVRVDKSKPEDRDDITNNRDNHTANRDGHGVVGDGGEDLTDDDNIHNGKATAHDHVEERANLCAVETKGVSRGCDGTETQL